MAAESPSRGERPATERLVLVGEESIHHARGYSRVGCIYSEGYSLHWLLVTDEGDLGEGVDVVASCDSTPSETYVFVPSGSGVSEALRPVSAGVSLWSTVCGLMGVASPEDLPEEEFSAWAFNTQMNASKMCTAETLYMESRGVPFEPPPVHIWKSTVGNSGLRYSVGEVPDGAEPSDGYPHTVVTCYLNVFPEPLCKTLEFGDASYSLEISSEWDADLKRWTFTLTETDDEGTQRTIALE